MLGCRLARMRIGEGMNEYVDTRVRRKLVGPLDVTEEGASSLSVRQQGADENYVARGRNADDVGVRNAIANCILRVNFGEGFGEMLRQTVALSCSCHRVPMVAHAAGIQHQREVLVRSRLANWTDRNKSRLAIWREKLAIAEEAGFRRRIRVRARPLKWRHPIEAVLVNSAEGADVEGARPIILER